MQKYLILFKLRSSAKDLLMDPFIVKKANAASLKEFND